MTARKVALRGLFLFAVLSGPLGLEYSSAHESQSQGECRTSEVVNDTSKAKYIITTCETRPESRPPGQKIEPKNTERNSKREPNEHWELINSFDDLAAQQRMADATEDIELWTFATTVISVIAVGLLIVTVVQTGRMVRHSQTAADSARETLNVVRDETAADLSITGVERWQSNGAQTGYPIAWSFGIQNIGKTGARDVHIYVQLLDRSAAKKIIVEVLRPFTDERLIGSDVVKQSAKFHLPIEVASKSVPHYCLFRLVCRDKFGIYRVNDELFYSLHNRQGRPTEATTTRLIYVGVDTPEEAAKKLNDQRRASQS